MSAIAWVAEVVLRLVIEAAILVAESWVGSMLWTGLKVAGVLWVAAMVIDTACRG